MADNEYKEFSIPLEKVYPDKDQPRKQFSQERIEELASSILAHGQIEPIIVTPDTQGNFKIIQGERRFRAFTLLSKQYPEEHKWKSIKATVIEKSDPILGIVSSIVRQELNTMEFAAALSELKRSCGEDTTNKKLANLVGKSETNISEWLSLNNLPHAVRDHAQKNNIISFRRLKILAAKNIQDSDKEAEYFTLCNEVKQGTTSFTQKLHKRLGSVNSHITATTSALKLLDKKLVSESLDDNDKQSLICSLDEIVHQAEDMLKKLRDNKGE